jgi:hypothetical protein
MKMKTSPSVWITVISVFLIGIMLIWFITGGLWERKAGSIDFHRIYAARIAGERQRRESAMNASVATESGAADQIMDRLYGGTFIPGFSTPPPVEPTARQRQVRARRKAERPLRLATQAKAIQDLRERLGGVPKEDVVVISWSERMWLDTALGCARPDEPMVSAKIPGWMFVLSFAGDRESFYIYNASRDGRQLRFCRKERKSTEPRR